jgi:3-phosphoshikimate 1-carboxyvinyltransferase
MSHTYPDELEITPLTKPPSTDVAVPGSKSITNRALVLAALTSSTAGCELVGALQSEDTEVMVEALRLLGYDLFPRWDLPEPLIRIGYHTGPRVPASTADVYVANSGTTVRFLTAMLATGRGRYRLDGVPRMRERPIQDLLDALNQLGGVNAYSEAGNGCPPVVVETTGLRGGLVRVRADVSSQFLSGLLMAAPFAEQPVTIEIVGPLVSEPYVEMTLAMMRQWRLDVGRVTPNVFRIPHYTGRIHPEHYLIEPDASAASYFFAAAAITGGTVGIGWHAPTAHRGICDSSKC